MIYLILVIFLYSLYINFKDIMTDNHHSYFIWENIGSFLLALELLKEITKFSFFNYHYILFIISLVLIYSYKKIYKKELLILGIGYLSIIIFNTY